MLTDNVLLEIVLSQPCEGTLISVMEQTVKLYREKLNIPATAILSTTESLEFWAHTNDFESVKHELHQAVKQAMPDTVSLVFKGNHIRIYNLTQSFRFLLVFDFELEPNMEVKLDGAIKLLSGCIEKVNDNYNNRIFSKLISNTTDAIQIVKSDGTLHYINESASQRLGIAMNEVENVSIFDFQSYFKSIDDWSRHVEHLKQKGPVKAESRHRNLKDGSYTPIEVSSRYIEVENAGYVVAVSRDISHLLEQRRLLHESEAHLKSILDSSPESIWSVNTNYEIVYINKVFVDLFKEFYHLDLKPGIRLPDLFPEELKNTWIERYDNVLANNYLQFSENLQTPSGDVKVFISMSPVIIDEKVVGVSVFGVNQNEKEQNRLYLKQSENRFRNLFYENAAAMYFFDPQDGRFIDVNPASERMYGWTKEEFTQKSIFEINASVENLHWKLEQLKKEKSGFFIMKHYRKDGTIIDLEISSCIIIVENQELVYEIVHNITERNLYYSTVAEQNRVLKEISWMQSHVVRAPLARILGLVHLLADSEFKELNQSQITELIVDSANELDGIIRDITMQSHEMNAKGLSPNSKN
ncbi:MAG: PAS domain S-box protein [Bacteroidia bacterium]